MHSVDEHMQIDMGQCMAEVFGRHQVSKLYESDHKLYK